MAIGPFTGFAALPDQRPQTLQPQAPADPAQSAAAQQGQATTPAVVAASARPDQPSQGRTGTETGRDADRDANATRARTDGARREVAPERGTFLNITL